MHLELPLSHAWWLCALLYSWYRPAVTVWFIDLTAYLAKEIVHFVSSLPIEPYFVALAVVFLCSLDSNPLEFFAVPTSSSPRPACFSTQIWEASQRLKQAASEDHLSKTCSTFDNTLCPLARSTPNSSSHLTEAELLDAPPRRSLGIPTPLSGCSSTGYVRRRPMRFTSRYTFPATPAVAYSSPPTATQTQPEPLVTLLRHFEASKPTITAEHSTQTIITAEKTTQTIKLATHSVSVQSSKPIKSPVKPLSPLLTSVIPPLVVSEAALKAAPIMFALPKPSPEPSPSVPIVNSSSAAILPANLSLFDTPLEQLFAPKTAKTDPKTKLPNSAFAAGGVCPSFSTNSATALPTFPLPSTRAFTFSGSVSFSTPSSPSPLVGSPLVAQKQPTTIVAEKQSTTPAVTDSSSASQRPAPASAEVFFPSLSPHTVSPSSIPAAAAPSLAAAALPSAERPQPPQSSASPPRVHLEQGHHVLTGAIHMRQQLNPSSPVKATSDPKAIAESQHVAALAAVRALRSSLKSTPSQPTRSSSTTTYPSPPATPSPVPAAATREENVRSKPSQSTSAPHAPSRSTNAHTSSRSAAVQSSSSIQPKERNPGARSSSSKTQQPVVAAASTPRRPIAPLPAQRRIPPSSPAPVPSPAPAPTPAPKQRKPTSRPSSSTPTPLTLSSTERLVRSLPARRAPPAAKGALAPKSSGEVDIPVDDFMKICDQLMGKKSSTKKEGKGSKKLGDEARRF